MPKYSWIYTHSDFINLLDLLNEEIKYFETHVENGVTLDYYIKLIKERDLLLNHAVMLKIA